MQEGGAFFGKNQVRKADTGDRARRARTQDRKGGEVGIAVLTARAGPNGKESVADTEGASEGRAGKSGKSGPLCSSGEEAGGYRGSRSKSTNTGPEGRGSRARGISYESRTLGEGGEGGEDGHFGTEVDKMTPKGGQFGRVRTCGTDIALSMTKTLKHVRLQKQAALLQSSMQNNYSYSSCKKRKLFNLN